MTTYSETFLCTAIPAGRSGNKLTLAILVSPRLGSNDPQGSPAPLSNWPDAENWPNVTPTWTVTIQPPTGSPIVLTGNEAPPAPYDDATWEAMFPGSMEVTPHTVMDRKDAPIASYPVAVIRDATKALHNQVMSTSRISPPSVDELRNGRVFPMLVSAANPQTQQQAISNVGDGPFPAAELELDQAFAMGTIFHGARPVGTGLIIPPQTLHEAQFGASYSGVQVVAVGGTKPYHWFDPMTPLGPSNFGLSISDSGVLSASSSFTGQGTVQVALGVRDSGTPQLQTTGFVTIPVIKVN